MRRKFQDPCNRSFHPTIASVTSCACAQAAPATLAGEANVRNILAYSEELPKVLAARISAGELPSTVLQSLLENHDDLERHDFGPLLVEAMGHSELIHYVWWWRGAKNSAARDMQFNIRVITRLLDEGVTLPWTLDYCESEEQRIGPLLATEIAEEKEAALAAVSFDVLVAKIKRLEGTPVCIQALWDGDTQGWHVWLSAVMKIKSKFMVETLGPVRFGGDIRLFKGVVPPWPEAAYALDVGQKLAQHFGAEFYFPSPDQPDIDQLGWIEVLEESKPEEVERPWWRIW